MPLRRRPLTCVYYLGAFNIGGWSTGSSLIALSLNVWQSMLAVVIGNPIVGVLCVFSGAPGAKWNIGFPVIQRASWGTTGFLFIIIQRFFLACIWYAINVCWGAQCLRVVLTAIAPSFRYINTPLAGGTLTTGELTCFIIFTPLYLPCIFIAPEKYRIPFLVSCACIIPTIFALLIFFTVEAQSGGNPSAT